MARMLRVHFPGALYHVIARGNNKNFIFESDQDKNHYLKLIEHYKEKFGFKLCAYVLMNNHVHLAIKVDEIPLAKIMQGIQLSYTGFFNHKYGHTGHVFQQRYKSILCNDDQYLFSLVRYIHFNPLRAQITQCINNYQWSSHRAYTSCNRSLVDIDYFLSFFSNDNSSAKKLYSEFMMHSDFDVELCHKYNDAPKELLLEEKSAEPELLLESLIKHVATHLEIPIEEVRSTCRDRRLVGARQIIIHLAIKNGICTRVDIANMLALTPSVITRSFAKISKDQNQLQIARDIELKMHTQGL